MRFDIGQRSGAYMIETSKHFQKSFLYKDKKTATIFRDGFPLYSHKIRIAITSVCAEFFYYTLSNLATSSLVAYQKSKTYFIDLKE